MNYTYAAENTAKTAETPALQRALSLLDHEQEITCGLIDSIDSRLAAVCTPMPAEPPQGAGLRATEPVTSPTTGAVNHAQQRQEMYNARLRRILGSLEV